MMNLTPTTHDVYFIHSLYKPYSKYDPNDVIIVKERHVNKSDNTYIQKLKYYPHPSRRYWITKEGIRETYTEKKETELLEYVNEYVSEERFLSRDIKKYLKFNEEDLQRFISLRELCDSPYIYGVDLPIEILVKKRYKDQEPQTSIQYTFGTFDIETSVFEDQRINVFTTSIKRTVRTSILKSFLDEKYHDNLDLLKAHVINRLQGLVNLKTIDIYTSTDQSDPSIWQWDIKICNNEYEMIQYNFHHIHELKPDFMGGWNARFDLTYILKRLKVLQSLNVIQGRIEDVLCHPDVPLEYRYIKYHEDTKKVDHFILNWDWFYCSGYTQFIDLMRLYGYLRKAKGLEPSYALNNILKKELNLQKLSFGNVADHATMQKEYFDDYIAYNIYDTIPLLLLEEKNHDIDSANAILGNCTFEKFNKTSVRISSSFYFYCLKHGRVPATVGKNMINEADKLMTAVGGAVLEPFRTKGSSIQLLKEIDIETLVFGHVSDLDFAAMYPNIIMAFNLSKETKIGTILKINNSNNLNLIEDCVSAIEASQENSVILGSRLFNLPGYEKMERLFLKKIKN
jgi:DNA polymerase elongation subunit (family B)